VRGNVPRGGRSFCAILRKESHTRWGSKLLPDTAKKTVGGAVKSAV